MPLRAAFILLACSICLKASAQFACIDSGRISPYYQCNDQFYNPVCGCDGITYRNQCNAVNNHGVLQLRSGVCNGLDLDFFPNPIGPATPLTVNLSYPEFINGNADVKIIDMYGKTWEQRLVNNFNRTMVQFDVSTLMTGVYMLVVSSSLNTFIVKKFAKY